MGNKKRSAMKPSLNNVSLSTKKLPVNCAVHLDAYLNLVPKSVSIRKRLSSKRFLKKFVTKLVPQLKPVEECVDIPKEVCSRSRQNPRKEQKPVVKKWCYVPSAESGLA